MRMSYLAGLVGGLLVAAMISGGGCTYNTYNYNTGGSGSASSSGKGGASSSASSATSSSSSGTMSSSSGMGGSGGGMASASISSGSGACVTDADSDGAISWQCAGGKDCADEDPKAHPDPMVLFQGNPIQGTKKPGTLNFDFNCDGTETAETPTVKCGLGCDPPQKIGFQNAVPCGMAAPLGHCAAVTCAFTPENPPQNTVQRCK